MPRRRLLAWLLAAVVAALAVRGFAADLRHARALPAVRAADALPVFLVGAAVADGADPTTQAGLKAAYERRGLRVRAATFSNLYPASVGVLARPLAELGWERFVAAWRWVLLLGGALAGLAAGLASARGPARPLAAALGAWIALSAFPVTGECAALGQANLLVAGLLGLAMAALRDRRDGLAAGTGVLGAALKLVPGVVLWPLLLARRWRGLLVGLGVGAVLAALTFAEVPPARVLRGVIATVRFQSAISPDWMNRPGASPWLVALGAFRHAPLMAWTLALSGVAAWLGRDRPAVLAGGVALASAWLGADASAFHVLYAPLFVPALAWAALWGLDEDAPRGALLLLPLAVLPAMLLRAGAGLLPEEARLVLAGLLTWAAVALRLLHDAPRPGGTALALLGAVAGWGLATAERYDDVPHGPPPEAVGDVRGWGLPEGVGHGGPVPGDPVAVPPDEAGRRIQLVEVLAPSTAERLTSHLVQAPPRWAAVDDPRARRLAAIAPPAPAPNVDYADMAVWLAWERRLLREVPGAESARREFERMWAVLARDPGR